MFSYLSLQVLRGEKARLQQVLDCLPQRKSAIAGGTAMAAALCSYLGPYPYNFRRLMLTVCWTNCLRERGIPLVVDSIHVIKGKLLNFELIKSTYMILPLIGLTKIGHINCGQIG